MEGRCSASRPPSGRPSISPSRSTPMISTTPISGKAPTGAKRRLRPRSTTPEPSMSLIRPLRATRWAGATLKARTMSRLPTGVGLSAMKSRISSRVGNRPSERRTLARASPVRPLLGGFWCRARLPLFAGTRFGTAGQSFLRSFRGGRGLALVLAQALALAAAFGREQLDRLLERHRLGLDLRGQRGVDAIMTDIGTVAAAEQVDRRTVRWVIAEDAQRCRPAPAALFGLRQQAHGTIEADGEHVVVLGERLVEVVMLDVGPETADSGYDLLARLGMEAHLARQRQEVQRRGEIDVDRRLALGEGHTLGLIGLVALATLNVKAVRSLAHGDGEVGGRIDAELARSGGQLVAIAVLTVAVLEGERPGVAAVGITRAADKGAELAEPEVEASDVAARAEARVPPIGRRGEEMRAEICVERLQHLGDRQILGAGHRGGEVAPEILQHLLPGNAAVGDLVELVLEIGGEGVLDIALEEALEEGGHDAAAILGDEALLVDPHIFSVLQHLDDRGIGGRAADAELLELLHQARLAVARRRLGEVLLRVDGAAAERLTFLDRRQAPVLLVPFDVVLVLAVEREEAVELDGRAGGAELQLLVRRGDVNRDLVDDGRRHLARHGTLPDELVELALVGLEIAGDLLGAAEHVGRPDRLMRLLRVLRLGLVDARLVRPVGFAVLLLDEAARRRDRLARHGDAIGPHIGDETDRCAGDVDALIEALGRTHCPAGAEAELARGLLLQRRGGEGRRRVAPDLLLLDRRDDVILVPEDTLGGGARRGLVGDVEFVEALAVEMGEAGGEALARRGRELDLDGPVFARLEHRDLGFALADEAERHRLHPTRRATARQLAPQHR